MVITSSRGNELPPLSLYVHLPWCVRKCPYCDFNSYTAGDDAPRAEYIAALLADIDAEAERASGRQLVSIFLGGGTPSFFSPAQIATVLDRIDEQFSLAPDIEITMEANPGTVESGDPAGYRRAGVNRLSVGAQSFSAASLALLGRIHNVTDIERSVREARGAGFDNINIDIMYGLPGQSVVAAIFDIEQAVQLEPSHLSWYQLTLEPNTVFHARPPAGLPDDEALYETQQAGQTRLAELDLEQYEVSAYARGGRYSVHNLNYWQFGDYLAIGAGAHGKISTAGGIWRYAKPANPRQYIDDLTSAAGPGELKAVSAQELIFEFMLNALRLTAGFNEQLFVARTGLEVECLRTRLAGPVEKGLIAQTGAAFWQVTPLGRRFLNDLQAEFLPE
jgi:oxygen-independent coproporphyrinogen-3 oxidase